MKQFYRSFFIACIFSLVGQTTFGQDNYKFENFGNKSILLNGNVTGSVADLGATFYNPARLALIENPGFTINAKLYELQEVKVEDFLGNGFDVSDSDFNGLPSMVAGTFKIKSLPGHVFAYSFISRQRYESDVDFDTGLVESDITDLYDGEELFSGRVILDRKIKDEWIGVSWATQLKTNFSVGASLFLSTYENSGYNRTRYTAFTQEETSIIYNRETGFSQKNYGIIGKLSAAWTLPKADLGLTIHLPELGIVNEGSFRYEESLAGGGAENDRFTFNNFDELDSTRRTAWGVSAGTGLKFGKHTVHLNGSWHGKINEWESIEVPPLESETGDAPNLRLATELKDVFNFGVGADFYLSPKFDLYASFSTDNSPVVKNTTLVDVLNRDGEDINLSTDYNHFGFGINMISKWADLTAGAVYSRGQTDFISNIDFPLAEQEDIGIASIEIIRWRFVFGIEVHVFNKAKKDLGVEEE